MKWKVAIRLCTENNTRYQSFFFTSIQAFLLLMYHQKVHKVYFNEINPMQLHIHTWRKPGIRSVMDSRWEHEAFSSSSARTRGSSTQRFTRSHLSGMLRSLCNTHTNAY